MDFVLVKIKFDWDYLIRIVGREIVDLKVDFEEVVVDVVVDFEMDFVVVVAVVWVARIRIKIKSKSTERIDLLEIQILVDHFVD